MQRGRSLNDLVREVLVLYDICARTSTLALADDPAASGRAHRASARCCTISSRTRSTRQAERPRILATASRSRADARDARLRVSDNGAGIAEVHRPAHSSRTSPPSRRAPGLGLAIVKKIVDEHHGRIVVENVKPHGAHVSIVLPLAEAAAVKTS